MLAFAAIADTPLADEVEVTHLNVPAAAITLTGHIPPLIGQLLRVFPPAANVHLTGAVAVIATGVILKPEQGRITLIKRAPASISTSSQVSVEALPVSVLFAPRPQVLTGAFSARRVVFVILRQTGRS